MFATIVAALIIAACNSGSDKKAETDFEPYVAVIDTSMTLLEIAKVNNIGEPYLRTQLGLRKKIGSSFSIAEMSRRYRFEIEDLRKIIEDRKNNQRQKTIPRNTNVK